ncbi:H-NS histone family protein [Sulfitobacter sp. BDSS02]|nr:H-NS histone family protein [Sulfitobacter sp. BDSS02]
MAVKAAQKAAAEFGFSLEDLTGKTTSNKASSAKFAHPENPETTWTGRGRQPAWYKELIEAGTDPNTLLIK